MATNNQQRRRISKTSSKKTATKTRKKASSSPMRREMKIFIASFITLVITLCYYTPVFSVFGNFVKNFGLAFLGYPAFFIPPLVGFIIMNNAIRGTHKPFGTTYLSVSFIMVLLSLLATIDASTGDSGYFVSDSTSAFELMIEGGTQCYDGGIIGSIGIPVMSFFGVIGSKIIIIFAVLLLIAIITKFVPFIWMWNIILKAYYFITEKFAEAAERGVIDADEELDEEEEEEVSYKIVPKQTKLDLDNTKEAKPKRERVKKSTAKAEKAENNSIDEMDIKIFLSDSQEEAEEPASNKASEDNQLPEFFASSNNKASEENTQTTPSAEIETEEITPTAEVKKTPNTAIELTDEEFIVPVKPYEFPPVSLLERNTERVASGKGPDLREQAKILVDTLKSFGVEAKILEVNKGPTVTRFELQPATGVKVSKIVNLADDIALNLAALSVRIEAPIPGKAAIGIEIPNAGNSIVRLREVIDSEAFRSFKAKTAFALGKDIAGTPIVTDISKMPHALIAGATGSGKSVCINSLITSIIYKADPKEVKFIMIDPKVVELSVYNGIPHLLIPVVTDPRKAAGALNWAVQEMTKRYKMFADNNVRDIKGYNELAELNGEKTLEQIIIIVDELADLMMVAPRDVEDAICRLAQMARAAGMHLVIATQRPSVDVITGVIKANVPSRIAFAVSSQIDSRTILDMGGAEKLLGKGDMLFLPMGASKPTRIQGAFISDKEVEKIVEFVKQEDVKYNEDVIEKIEKGITGDKEESGGDADELLPKAIEIVVEAGQASASLLQRRLSVGYSRAGRLIDQLEARGIIGPHEGAKPRSVLMSRAEYAEMIMQKDDN